MPSAHFATSPDLPSWALITAITLAGASLVMLIVEMRRREHGGVIIALTGLVALAALVAAVARPVWIDARESVVGPRVVVLADASRSMALDSDGTGKTRRAVRDEAIRVLRASHEEARISVLGFGSGAPAPLPEPLESSAHLPRSNLSAALRALAQSSDERPHAIVVVSDGRLDDPPDSADEAVLRAATEAFTVPIHTLATTREAPADASVRRVAAAGAAVAHVPLPLQVEVGCAGPIDCSEPLQVTASELRHDGTPAVLAMTSAKLKDGKAVVDLTVTLERAGARIVEIAISAPSGDTIPENNRRLVAFNVARERVRVLHVAGRPTNDVRALRQWLKSDASVDVVAFFILRTASDYTGATSDELALIPFPVDELFTHHLSSFDAVILQDFDAVPYGLMQYLPGLAEYVRGGGGLVMVGGPQAFVAGGYAGTPLAQVLPVSIDASRGATASDTGAFVPEWTEQGLAAPMLAPLRSVVGTELPNMPGTNVLGDVGPGGVVLWSHPVRKTKSGAPMPVLAVGDEKNGRSIALSVDGGWLLQFSALGARTAGRGHGALWDGLLGWLMRDPRFEPAQIDVLSANAARQETAGDGRRSDSPAQADKGCVAGLASVARARLLPTLAGAGAQAVSLDVSRMDRPATQRTGPARIHVEERRAPGVNVVELPLPPLEAGGYTAELKVGGGGTTRFDFACEAGGDEWADSRPDGARLEAIARVTGGTFAWASEGAGKVPLPKPTVVSSQRHVIPVAPPWVWTLVAAAMLGAHWFARRRSGLH